MKQLKILFATLFFISPLAVNAAIIGVDWQSRSETSASGELGGISVDISDIGFVLFKNNDLSGANFSAAPLGSSQEVISHSHDALWSATFGESINDLLLYGYFYRGPSLGNGDPATYTYTFDKSFSILAGFSGASVSGNSLIMPTNSFGFGIIQFNGALSSLSLTSTTALNGNYHNMTLGLDTDAQAVTEPAMIVLMTLCVAGMVTTRRNKKV